MFNINDRVAVSFPCNCSFLIGKIMKINDEVAKYNHDGASFNTGKIVAINDEVIDIIWYHIQSKIDYWFKDSKHIILLKKK